MFEPEEDISSKKSCRALFSDVIYNVKRQDVQMKDAVRTVFGFAVVTSRPGAGAIARESIVGIGARALPANQAVDAKRRLKRNRALVDV